MGILGSNFQTSAALLLNSFSVLSRQGTGSTLTTPTECGIPSPSSLTGNLPYTGRGGQEMQNLLPSSQLPCEVPLRGNEASLHTANKRRRQSCPSQLTGVRAAYVPTGYSSSGAGRGEGGHSGRLWFGCASVWDGG